MKKIIIFVLAILFVVPGFGQAGTQTVLPEEGNQEMNQMLLYGVLHNDFEMVQKAIENGANVNIYENKMRLNTPLIMSLRNPQIVDYLIGLGADVNAQVNLRGWPGAKETPLMKSVGSFNLVAIQKLTESGAYVNFEDMRGYRALNYAVMCDAPIKIVQYLLSVPGIEINYHTKWNDNDTPLMMAVSKQNIPVIHALLDAGADTQQRDLKGRAAKDYAILTKNQRVIDIFFKK